ncbi:MAG: LL-diaminopimelate aminotransferase [Bdellovibrionota bacterium]
MLLANENHTMLQSNYLFAQIADKVKAFKKANPQKNVISLGIGDVTMPLCKSCITAMHKAVDDMADESTFKGYPEYEGYDFLIEKIVNYDYKNRGIDITSKEVFVSDGAKSDTANIQELFSKDLKIAVLDPVYPVYVDSNVMAGRANEFKGGRWSNIVYLECLEENSFIPNLPKEKVDLIYLCFPNNPTGMCLNKAELKKFVDYAIENNCIILFDAAYEAFITKDDIPHSIYEIENAKKVAIEFKSFSKTAGFTGVRCAYTVIPNEITIFDKVSNSKVSVNRLWYRRQATKFNGVSYITQRGAEAIYSKDGQKEIKATINYYLENAKIIKEALTKANLTVYGGENSPYLWVKTIDGMSSWDFFDYMLSNFCVVGTPGSGFGKSGEHFFRFTSFASRENTIEASKRLENI